MAVEAELVIAVVQLNRLVLDPQAIHFPFGFQRLVTFHAVVAPAKLDEIESLGLTGRRLVEVGVCGQHGRGHNRWNGLRLAG